MKRYIVLILIITAFFALILRYGNITEFINKYTNTKNIKESESDTLTQIKEGSNEKNSFTVLIEDGEVFYGNGEKYTLITEDEITLPNKTYIQTKEGTAQIILANNSVITLDNNTEIQINSEEKKTAILQLYGNTWHRVKSILEIGEYVVKTDNTIAAVRGTVFSVNIDKDGSTDVHVVEHSVEVTKGQELDGNWVDEEINLIEEGKKARVISKKVAAKNMEVIASEVEFKNSDWFKNNRDKDELLKMGKQDDIKKFMREKVKQKRSLLRNSELRLLNNQKSIEATKDKSNNASENSKKKDSSGDNDDKKKKVGDSDDGKSSSKGNSSGSNDSDSAADSDDSSKNESDSIDDGDKDKDKDKEKEKDKGNGTVKGIGNEDSNQNGSDNPKKNPNMK